MPNEPELKKNKRKSTRAGTDAGSLKKFRVQEDDVFVLWSGGVGSTICSELQFYYCVPDWGYNEQGG